MGKRWRPYRIGSYRLGYLNGQAVATWRDGYGRHRFRLGKVATEHEARGLLAAFAHAKASAPILAGASAIGDLFSAYIANREADGKLVAAFRFNWKALSATFSALSPDEITDDLCRSYTKMRMESGVKIGTVWTELTRLRSCLNWAAKRKLLAPPAPYVWVPTKPDARTRVLSDDEIERLLAACVMPHIRLFVILALSTGARSAALLELTWSRVNFEAGTIDLRRPEPVNPLTRKARKGRAVVPMNGWARAALAEAAAAALTDHVIEWNGEAVRKIRKGFERACERAGLSGVTPHDLRRTAATMADEAGIDPARIARFLGHTNVLSGEAYRHPRPRALQPVADVLDMRKKVR